MKEFFSKLWEFVKTFLKSMNPDAYREIKHRSAKQTIKYFLALVFVMYIITIILSFNNLIHMPDQIRSEFSKLNGFSLKIKHNVTEPIVIPTDSPIITIDLSGNDVNLTRGNLLITNDYIKYKIISSETRPIKELSDVPTLLSIISDFLYVILILMLPALFVMAYLFFVAKFILLIAASSIVIIILVRLSAVNMGIGDIFKTAIHASTIMVILEFLSIGLGFSAWMLPVGLLFLKLYIVPYLLFLVTFAVTLKLASERDFIHKIHKKDE